MSTILQHIARYLLGTIFLVFGLNGFYTFIPVPEFHPFMEMLVSSGYIYVVKAVEVIVGVLLLSNRLVPLALIMITPVVINIVAYHALLDDRNWQITPLIVVLLGYLIFHNRDRYASLLVAKSETE